MEEMSKKTLIFLHIREFLPTFAPQKMKRGAAKVLRFTLRKQTNIKKTIYQQQ